MRVELVKVPVFANGSCVSSTVTVSKPASVPPSTVIVEWIPFASPFTFRNVPAFSVYLDRAIEVPKVGTVTVDVAYGGMFYVIADARAFGLALTPDEGRDIVRITEMVKAAAREQLPVTHPEQPGFTGISIGQLSGPPSRPVEDDLLDGVGADARAPLRWCGR